MGVSEVIILPDYIIGDMIFNWNEEKAESNLQKHGVSFEEAATVFSDEDLMIMTDEDYNGSEERFLLLGYSRMSRILIVCHCYRGEDDNIVRIISARKATKTEEKLYRGTK